MRFFPPLAILCAVSACVSVKFPEPADLVKKTVSVDGRDYNVRYRTSIRERAQAFGDFTDRQPIPTAAAAIESATGCAVSTADVSFSKIVLQSGAVGYQLDMDCETTPAAAPASAAPSTASAPAQSFPAVAGSPPLFEGSSYAAFSAEQISAYCAQNWVKRVGPSGRTEYNPCKSRSSFR